MHRLIPTILVLTVALTGQLGLSPLADVANADVVLLNNGNTLTGQAVREGDKLAVYTDGSEIRLDVREVDYVAADFEDAYRHQLGKCDPRNLDDQANLIAWALRHNLYAQATDQLFTARRWHGQAPRLVQLETSLRSRIDSQNKVAAANGGEVRQVSHTESVMDPRREAGASSEPMLATAQFDSTKLSNETIAHFTTRIQPLFINSCATTHCHGRMGDNGFTIVVPSASMPLRPEMTRRNLASTLRFVDKENPEKSDLLAKAAVAHGVRRDITPMLTDAQMEMLTEWTAGSTENQTRSVPASIRVKLVGHLLQPDNKQPTSHLIDPLQAAMGNRNQPDAEDPFDPAEFNRQFHGEAETSVPGVRPLPR